MWKKILIALICLEIVLVTVLRNNPVNATVSDPATYTWDFRRIGSEQVVCKQVTIRPGKRVVPKSSDKQSIQVRSQIVADSYCANLTKPVSIR
ncbi:MAG: hypothetical protein WA865_03110 [Spirulinaceae cyanobacterium]